MRAKVNYWLGQGVRSVELIAADYIAQRFSPHWHAGFAIGAVTKSAQGFHTGGRTWIIGPGDLIVLNPGQIHDGYSLHQSGWSSRMAYVPEATFACLAGAEYDRTIAMRFERPVVYSPALCRSFLEWHCLSESVGDLREHSLTAEVFAELQTLMRPSRPAPIPREPHGSVLRLREQLHVLAIEHCSTVSRLTAKLERSRTTSWRRIKDEFGLAPKPLLNQFRLMSAKEMLAHGCPVIEAALDCGYHDQAHLSRQFAAAYGMTPAQFRRAQLSAEAGLHFAKHLVA